MDVKQYYRKLKEIEATLEGQYPVVISVETADGGKSGVMSEVSRAIAAKLIVEGRAVLATDMQREEYLVRQAANRSAAAKAELARRVQVAIIADPESVSTPKRPTKASNQE
jgi:phosphopantothenoylcysteine synthetase/decarboxylase